MNNTTSNLFPNCFNISGVVTCRVFPPPPPLEIQELMQLNSTLSPIFTAMAFVLLAIALIGNCLIIMTIFKDPRIHGMAHVFLLNIAVADVLYALVNFAGETLQLALTAEQKRSNTMRCTVNRPLITIRFSCYGAAVFSLAAMSIERWYAICQPFAAARKTSNKKRLKFTAVFVIWVLAVGVSWPLLLCSFGHERVHTIVLAVSFLVLPFLAIVVANGKIILSIKKAGLFVVSRKIGQETRRRRKHLLNLLFAIIISFVVLWLPYTALYVFMGFVKIKDLVIYLKLMITARAVAVTSYIHPALNSFLYYGFCRDFRRGLASLMRKSTSRTTASRN